MELLAIYVQPLIIFAEISIFDALQGSESVSVEPQVVYWRLGEND